MVRVVVFRLYIDEKTHQMARARSSEYQIQPWLEPMTEAEYAAEMEEILAELPEEFRSFVRGHAWSEGHSAGYEVILIARDLVEVLSPAVANFTRRIKP